MPGTEKTSRIQVWMSHRLGIGLLGALLVLLPLLAGASPIDPGWITGIYDDADGDEAIARIDGTCASTHGADPESLSLAPLSETLIHPQATRYECSRALPRERGPPQFTRLAQIVPAPSDPPGPALPGATLSAS
jgi:hypothetical protein